MRGVRLLNHFYTLPRVLHRFVDISSFHQPHKYIDVAKARGCAALIVSVNLKIQIVEDGVHESGLRATENHVRGFRFDIVRSASSAETLLGRI